MPFPKTGACEQDRGYGIEDLIRLGYDVRVIAKSSPNKTSLAGKESSRLGIILKVLPYVGSRFLEGGMRSVIRRIFSPKTWDGAANEYFDPLIQDEVSQTLKEFDPDVVWVDYTYLWPLYKLIQKNGTPIITRSINFEPSHFLQEDGVSFINLIKYLPKLVSEIIIAKRSSLVLSITPQEENIYKKYGAMVRNLPLRGLPHLLVEDRTIADKEVLDVFFFGSTYNVHHNRYALQFFLKKVIPVVQAQMPGKFKFHILGGKIPSDLESLCNSDVIYEGYVNDLDEFLKNMDIAVIPSLMGAGMQQKIFEPLVRGIPLVTSPRGIAGYPFSSPVDYRAANTPLEFAEAIISLQNIEERRKLSKNSLEISKRIFSKEVIDLIVTESISKVTEKNAGLEVNNL